MRSPLPKAAVTGWARQGVWAVLVLAAFAVASLAAASAPIQNEASGNAVFADRLAAVPGTAALAESPVVRISTSSSPRSADQQAAVRDLRSIPHLTAPRPGGGSVGAELAGQVPWTSTVTSGGRALPARLFAVDDPATALGAAPSGDGLWLPRPVADELGVHAGDTVTYTVATAGRQRSAAVRIAGVYATSGRLPVGDRSWASQRTSLPADPTARTLSAFLLIGDVATIEGLAAATDDRILWWADASLAPGTTLAGARETVAAIERLRVRVAQDAGASSSVVTPRVISGIGRVTEEATGVVTGVESRMRTVEWAAIAIGLLSVLAVGLLSVRRRSVELRHAVGTGVTPVGVGLLWFLEHLGPALVAGALGWAGAWGLLAVWGPPGDITAASLVPAAGAAGLVAVAGSLAAAGVAATAASRRVRPAPPAVPVRPRPWGLLVVVAAAVAGVGLWGSTRARGIDRAVPLLVLAAAGVLAGMLLVRVAGGGSGRASRIVPWLVRRRVAAGGERPLTVMVLSAGLGMLAFALCALDSVAVVTEDRVAVQAGAAAVAQIPGSWLLDPDPPPPLPPPRRGEPPPGEGLVPGLKTPPLPAHATFVWRIDADTPLDYGARDLVAIDPERFLRVASWGRGAGLAEARRAVGRLATADPAAALPGRPVPAIVVGDGAVAGVRDVPVDLGPWKGRLDVVAHLPAFPGLGERPLFVVPDLVMFTHLGRFDPRLSGSVDSVGGMLVRTYLWSSAGTAGISEVLAGPGIQPDRITTAAAARQRPGIIAADRTRGYQLSVAAYLALLAVVALCVFSERTSSAGRPADLMLARVGVGRRRVVLARAAELAVLVAAALAGAAAGLAVLAPLAARLLDGDPTLVPELRFTVPPSAVLAPLVVALVATAAATALAMLRARTREEEAYRAGD